MTVEAMIKALQKEADRRAALGHHALAHELRSIANDVRRAQATLANSKRVS